MNTRGVFFCIGMLFALIIVAIFSTWVDPIIRRLLGVKTVKQTAMFERRKILAEIPTLLFKNLRLRQNRLHEEGDEDIDCCPVCLSDFEDLMLVRATKCGHVFCAECLEAVVGRHKRPRTSSCPLCRAPLDSQNKQPGSNKSLSRVSGRVSPDAEASPQTAP